VSPVIEIESFPMNSKKMLFGYAKSEVSKR